MDNDEKNEFEKRIRFEEGIKKDVEHLRGDFNTHLKDEEKYTEKFEKIQESHNNLFHRFNNVEDNIDEMKIDNKNSTNDIRRLSNTVNSRFNKIDKKILILMFAIAVIGIISLIALTTHPIIFKFLKPIISIFI